MRIVLALVGLGFVFLGLNAGLGGIETLGWQGIGSFLNVTDRQAFEVQDSHARFMAGFFLGGGPVLIAAAWRPAQFRQAVVAVLFMVFFGGLIRLASANWAVLFSWDVLPSLVAELTLLPALAVWVWRGTEITRDPDGLRSL